MGTRQHERTLKMMENFVRLHNEGHSINEIAEEFSLSATTVYNKLGEIAEKAGMSREELLEKPIVADHSGRNFCLVKPVDLTKFNESFDALMKSVDDFKAEIGHTIEELEATHELLQEEMR